VSVLDGPHRARRPRGVLLAAIAVLAVLSVSGVGSARATGSTHPTRDRAIVLHRGNDPTLTPRVRLRPATAGIAQTLVAAPPGAVEAATPAPSLILHDRPATGGAAGESGLPPSRAPPR